MRDSSNVNERKKRKIEKAFIIPDFSLKGSRCIYFLRIRKGMTLVIVFFRERGKIADTMNIETDSAIFYSRFGYYYNWSTSSIFNE